MAASFPALQSPSAGLPGLEWKPINSTRVAAVSVPHDGRTGFTLLPPSTTGIAFTNLVPESRHLGNQILLNGSGVACGDVDGDGWCDLYFCGLTRSNVLYRNLGQWRFEDMTADAGVACPGMDSSGAAFADLEGDGDLDLIVNTVGNGTLVFQNDGRGRFSPLGLLNPGKSGTSLALGDVNGDGYLDLYIANYRSTALMDMPNTRFWFKMVNGQRVVDRVNGRSTTEPDLTNRYAVNASGGIEELGEPDAFYLSTRGTNFTQIPFTRGAFLDEGGKPLSAPPFEWGLSVMIRDFNADGWPDIYVCNDFDSPDRLWLNRVGQGFQLAPRLALRKSALFCMALDVADINRDGHDDLFLLDMLSRDHVHRLTQMGDRKPSVPIPGLFENRPQHMMNMLFLNRGDGTYAEIGQFAGVQGAEWAWAVVFLDADLDGWEDLLISNGNERDGRNLDVADQLRAFRTQREMTPAEILSARKAFPRYATRNLAYRNQRDLTFAEVGREWGFDLPDVSNGTALADLDNDGDLDLAVNRLNAVAGVYRNETTAPRLAVRLRGQPPNTAGVGAKIKVLGGPVTQSQEMICGGRYLSCDQAQRAFAAGSLSNRLTIEVTWRSGLRSAVTNALPNHLYEVAEAGAAPLPRPATEGDTPQPFFQDVSSLLQHTHVDEAFDDYARQPLLSRKLSQLGPGVAWSDLDHDGWDDLLIGSGKGGRLSVYRNDGRGSFKPWKEPPFDQPITRDQTTILTWPRGPGDTVVLAGSANYEDGLAVGSCARLFDLKNRTVTDALPAQESSTGPMALADIDGDGDLDLFAGGRVVPGRYPQPASSRLFKAAGGGFEIDAENSRILANVGLVSGAVFSDLDADGDPDLLLACEWGPVRVFFNNQGRFTEATAELGLDKLLGWWNGVNTGDFDGDGRLDIVASNWGRNTPYEWHRSQPLRLIHGDLDGNGTEDLIEAYFDTDMKQWVPERMLSFYARGLPLLRQRFPTYESFACARVEEICGDAYRTARQLQANCLESTLFLNRGNRFEARSLPVEAQLAPAFAVCVGDLDGDSHEDLFLSQNFFPVQPDIPRCDAGRGLWLRGDGKGSFRAVSGQEGGLKVYGEQRGAALCDYDGDGRPDLAVTQNGTQTKLYQNARAQPGLRVRLDGPAGNPHGVGAVLRLVTDTRTGPAREIHAGSGYWSQDSVVQILAAPSSSAQLLIRWPGGNTVMAEIPQGAREVAIDPQGSTRRIR